MRLSCWTGIVWAAIIVVGTVTMTGCGSQAELACESASCDSETDETMPAAEESPAPDLPETAESMEQPSIDAAEISMEPRDATIDLRMSDAEELPAAEEPFPDPVAERSSVPKIRMLAAPRLAAPEMAPEPVEPLLESGEVNVPASSPAPPPLPAPRLADESLGAAERPASASSDTPKTTQAPAPQPEREDYTTVSVFYGTDRLAIDAAGAGGASTAGTLLALGIVVAMTLAATAIAVRLSRRRLAIAVFAAGALGSVATAILPTVLHHPSGTAHGGPTRTYGNQRGELEMGICEVSIPKRHEIGQVERPSVLRLEFKEDPTRHVVLMDVVPEPAESFHTKLSERIGQSVKREAFVFVHGFNVTFEAAARRTAQLAYDLKFEGAPIFFSWPSQGGLLQYTVDETNVIWAVPHLKEFLLGIVEQSGAQSIHLIAHSMGNRALTAALQSIAYEFRDRPPMFNQVILTAPDIDADVFRRDIAPPIIKTAGRVTLYASSNDEALVLSKQIHGYPRAGDSGNGLLVIPGMDTIDVSTIDTSLIGHSYYGSNSTVLDDLLDLLHESKPPEKRPWLHPMQLGRMMYWVFLAEKARLESAAAGPATRTQ